MCMPTCNKNLKTNRYSVGGLFLFKYLKYIFCFLKKDLIYLFLDRGEGREKEKERNINVWLLLA